MRKTLFNRFIKKSFHIPIIRMDKMNARSSSQRSIYDYPEHLNPFYEDENHKRLRFWKIGGSNRSNSFSMDGLRGLW